MIELKDITDDRVRSSSPSSINDHIDRITNENISFYSVQNEKSIKTRILELEKEWDIERVLQLNASLIAFSGLVLSIMNRKWLVVPTVVSAFLAQHAIQGWCPPVVLFRNKNIRTRKEIDREKYALVNKLNQE